MQIFETKNDFHTSLTKALDEIDKDWRSYNGLIVAGSHAPSEVEDKIDALKRARENEVPTLGICFGMQLMAIEYARNVLKIKDATSAEFGEGTPIVSKLPELRVGIHAVAIDNVISYESHWHNYSIQMSFADLSSDTFTFTSNQSVLEYMKHDKHPFYVGVQFHPEYQSSKDAPHKILVEFIDACKHA